MYTNIHSGLIIIKVKIDSYETTVPANRVANIYCNLGSSKDLRDHTGIIQLIFLPQGRTNFNTSPEDEDLSCF